MRHGKGTLYEGGIRVPFIISGPKIKPGSTSSIPISGIDLLPTIQDIVSNKVEIFENLDGGSFKQNLFSNQNAIINRNNNFLVFHLPFRRGSFNPHSAIIQDNFKLIKFLNTNKKVLFDLSTDTNEKNDISNSNPEKTNQLEYMLEDYLKKVGAPKWKKGINWRPYDRTLEDFNSFY